MSTQLQNFDTNQDALTIFFDLQSEQNMIDIWMKELFEEGQSLYLNKEMDGNSLFAHLRDLIREGELLFPNSGRMLFCYYLPLENLTEDNLTQMLDFANAAAGIITTRKGALKVMPSLEEITSLIQ